MFVLPISNSINFSAVTEVKRSEPVHTEENEKSEAVFADKKSEQTSCDHCHHKSFNVATTTGWVAAGLLGTAVVSGMAHYNTVHKATAFLGTCAAAAHIGAISSMHNHHKKCVNVSA